MLKRNGNKKVKKKLTYGRAAHFIVISLPLFCTTATKNFLVTHFIEEMIVHCMCYCLLFLFFFTSAHFYLGGR